MEGFYINQEVGPFITTLTEGSVYGDFKDLPIPLNDDVMLALGINKLEDYAWSDIEHHHVITWTVNIRSQKSGIYYDSINIISIASRILFEYSEPHSTEAVEYEWEQQLDLKEWQLDLEDLNWRGENGLYIDEIELNFGRTNWKDKKKYKIIKLSSPNID